MGAELNESFQETHIDRALLKPAATMCVCRPMIFSLLFIAQFAWYLLTFCHMNIL